MYRDKTIVLYRARKGKRSRGKSSVQSFHCLQPGACRAELLGNLLGTAWGRNGDPNSINKAPPTILDDETQRARAPGKGLSEDTQVSIKLLRLEHRPSLHL